MATAMLTPADFATSVVAVPPIALRPDHGVAVDQNAILVRHILSGGVDILLYGGNANLYHFSLAAYAEALEMMEAVAGSGRIITSIGPSFGTMLDQVPLIERSSLRNVMLLPVAFPADSHGTTEGIRRIVDRLGFGVIVYLKRDNYVRPEVLEKLVADGAVRFIKYAVERPAPEDDAYLDAVLSAVGREHVASGMGETPIIDHVGARGVATYTSGAVCIAPAAAMALLATVRSGDKQRAATAIQPFLDFERVRSGLGGIQVLHSAVTASGIADMGPMMPMVSVVKERNMPEVRRVVVALMEAEQQARQAQLA
jgi:dihydrodipicolinate synthase/N-acetylneuraminate lyase